MMSVTRCLFFPQSHISENRDEVKLVKELFPDNENYTDVYHKHNLLTGKVSYMGVTDPSVGKKELIGQIRMKEDIFRAKPERHIHISGCPECLLLCR